MERTNKKECPKCKSLNVFDTNNKGGDVDSMSSGRKITEPNRPIYKCRDCQELFILLNEVKI